MLPPFYRNASDLQEISVAQFPEIWFRIPPCLDVAEAKGVKIQDRV